MITLLFGLSLMFIVQEAWFKMEVMVEKVEKNKREEITHQQNSQEEMSLE